MSIIQFITNSKERKQNHDVMSFYLHSNISSPLFLTEMTHKIIDIRHGKDL